MAQCFCSYFWIAVAAPSVILGNLTPTWHWCQNLWSLSPNLYAHFCQSCLTLMTLFCRMLPCFREREKRTQINNWNKLTISSFCSPSLLCHWLQVLTQIKNKNVMRAFGHRVFSCFGIFSQTAFAFVLGFFFFFSWFGNFAEPAIVFVKFFIFYFLFFLLLQTSFSTHTLW